MGELCFIGLGLHDERDVSLKGLDYLRAADLVLLERYTSLLGVDAARLEQAWGVRIRTLGREEVEHGEGILDEAQQKRVAFLAVGDSMAATTHQDLRIRAAKRGIPTRIIHGASALTAIPALLGLQSYKFGRTTTLAFPHGAYLAESPYEVVAANLERGLHTLCLLDLDLAKDRCMTASEGAQQLLTVAAKRGGDAALGPATLGCVVARAGSDAPLLRAAPLAELARADFGPPLHSLVVPGKLHELEEEALRAVAGLHGLGGLGKLSG